VGGSLLASLSSGGQTLPVPVLGHIVGVTMTTSLSHRRGRWGLNIFCLSSGSKKHLAPQTLLLSPNSLFAPSFCRRQGFDPSYQEIAIKRCDPEPCSLRTVLPLKADN
jgi:hypothetical protein